MSNHFKLMARYLHHCRTIGFSEAGRRYRESKEDEQIRRTWQYFGKLSDAERKKQEKTVFPKKIHFRVLFLKKNGIDTPCRETLQSLKEQTYQDYEIKAARDETDSIRYTLFMEPDGILHPGALFRFAKNISETGADLLYSDEDYYVSTPVGLNHPWFKPDFGPDSVRGCNYIGPLMVCSAPVLAEEDADDFAELSEEERWDVTIRMAKTAKKIVHIPECLYFRKTEEAGMSIFPSIRRIMDPLQGQPMISILIPNRDHVEDLSRCIDSVREKSTWPEYEILILENNSIEKKTFQYYKELQKDPRIRIIQKNEPFNYSMLNNLGFRESRGEYILLLNNDTEVVSPEWIKEMLMFAQRDDVGAVGAKLDYPDGTIQHAGIGIGIKIAAGHYHRGFPKDSPGYFGRLTYAQNVSAVTGACMMIPRHVYDEMGGLDESFRVVFNDIDLCLRIREAGYQIVWTPWAELVHYESRSRGSDEETKRKRKNFRKETNRFLRKWTHVLKNGDPYYNPNLTRKREDFSLRD